MIPSIPRTKLESSVLKTVRELTGITNFFAKLPCYMNVPTTSSAPITSIRTSLSILLLNYFDLSPSQKPPSPSQMLCPAKKSINFFLKENLSTHSCCLQAAHYYLLPIYLALPYRVCTNFVSSPPAESPVLLVLLHRLRHRCSCSCS